MKNYDEKYSIDTHLGNNLIKSVKLITGKDYKENEVFTQTDDDKTVAILVNTITKEIFFKAI